MQQLLSQLGIDWHLLLSQAVNFALLLVVLRYYAYKPLLKLMHDRRTRIEEGIAKAKEADQRLLEADAMKRGKIKEAETEAIGILRKAETDARAEEERMLTEAKRKEAEAMRGMDEALRLKEEEARQMMEREAAVLVKSAIVKAVELSPAMVDDALVLRAIREVKQSKA